MTLLSKIILIVRDLDLWPNDPKINRVLPLPQGYLWPSLFKIQDTELKLSCGNDPVVKNYIYSDSDLDLWPNDPKINRVLPLPQGNHVAKFGKDLIYRTKVIVRKPVWTPAHHTQSHNMAPSRDGRIKKKKIKTLKIRWRNIYIYIIYIVLLCAVIILHFFLNETFLYNQFLFKINTCLYTKVRKYLQWQGIEVMLTLSGMILARK